MKDKEKLRKRAEYMRAWRLANRRYYRKYERERWRRRAVKQKGAVDNFTER